MSQEQKSKAMSEAGELVVAAILESVGEGRSPVSGEPAFRALSKEYKKFKAQESGSTQANMELTGSMLDSLEYQITGRNILEVGIFDENEGEKADNHNKFSAKSKGTNVPQRRFIPDKDQTFKRDIIRQIKDVIDAHRDQGD